MNTIGKQNRFGMIRFGYYSQNGVEYLENYAFLNYHNITRITKIIQLFCRRFAVKSSQFSR